MLLHDESMVQPSWFSFFPFFLVAGVTIEEVENEEELEVRGYSQEEIIGVVFKDDFSYCLRFQGYSVVSPNDAYGDMGNKIKQIRGLDFTLKHA